MDRQKVYLVALIGQGDEEYRLVSEEVFNWINSPVPEFPDGECSMSDPATPEEVKAYRRLNSEDDECTYITTGSCQNDRALNAAPLTINGTEASFYTSSELWTFVNKNNLDIVNSYTGMIY